MTDQCSRTFGEFVDEVWDESYGEAPRFDEHTMWGELSESRTLGVLLTWFTRRLNATPEQRAGYEIGRYGLYWAALDEDISIGGVLAGRGDMAHRPKF